MGRIQKGVEPKTERMVILVTPRTKENLEKIRAVQRTSLNRVVNDAITEYLEDHQDDIHRFNDFFGEE